MRQIDPTYGSMISQSAIEGEMNYVANQWFVLDLEKPVYPKNLQWAFLRWNMQVRWSPQLTYPRTCHLIESRPRSCPCPWYSRFLIWIRIVHWPLYLPIWPSDCKTIKIWSRWVVDFFLSRHLADKCMHHLLHLHSNNSSYAWIDR